MNKKLCELDNNLKNLLFAFMICLTTGVLFGLAYLYHTTQYSTKTTIERYNGSVIDTEDEFAVPENYPKPISEILITTHNHIISFSFIFFLTGVIFYFNSIIGGKLKSFLIIEPFISTIISFGSLMAMRFVDKSFVYVTAFSSTILYLSFFVMVMVIIYDLKIKKFLPTK